MNVAVQTGASKAKRGTALVSESRMSGRGEEVVVLLHVEASPQDAKQLEKECLTVVEHALLETDGDAAERLDGSLKEMNGLFKGLSVAQSIGEIHAIVAIVDTAGILHVSHAGRAEAYVVRGGAASQITEYTRGKSMPAFVHIASGGLEPRDVIIFSTQRLLRTVTPAQLAQLAQRGDHLMDELTMELESEGEQAALAIVSVSGRAQAGAEKAQLNVEKSTRARRRTTVMGVLSGAGETVMSLVGRLKTMVPGSLASSVRKKSAGIIKDLSDPKRKRRAHLLLLAGVVAVFLVIWVVVNLSTGSQRRQTRAELESRLEEVGQLLRTAENRRLSGEIDSTNAILEQAQERAKQVMDNESNLFRAEALGLLEKIQTKREEINNIVRISPYPVANLSAKDDAVDALGVLPVKEGEFAIYDRQNIYRVLLSAVDNPERVVGEELILDGDAFPRYQTMLFMLTDQSVIELINGQPTSMKTDDPAGWIKGTDVKTYLRYLYLLSPENNQIYKYERLTNRYGPPAQYNVNGDLSGALDMDIDGSVFILKKGGQVVKLLRGEVQPFAVRHLPEGALSDASKVFKVPDGHLYFLDPKHAKVIVTTDGGATGGASYVKQFVLQGDTLGELRDLYVDDEENKLYLLDAKRVHGVDLR
ncbi:hypothetical protein FJZ28_02365 [Candidatus Peregrinibacteria bacterium]|nr:hypothetical protein [Candidatus Peregrinibacteria bacterium]